jgi:4-amino-4-deoxy-L-arabinose transferase-like glycosyltransferase
LTNSTPRSYCSPVNRRADLFAILFVAGVWALVVALVGVGGDFPLNDDWAYAYSARHLLRTGELRILDWAAPSLLTHALWGAGLLRLLGDSYVVLRCGTLAWALVALLCVYSLARSAALEPRVAVVAPLALGLSPWFVNLAFTYMTDVPWLALMLAALVAFVHALHPRSAERPRPAFLLLCGALVGAAALTRQLAIIVTPAFAMALGLDAARRHGARWRWPAARGCLLFGGPVAALFVPYQIWYTRIHGATLANRDTFGRILEVRPLHLINHSLSTLNYAGLWLFPLALALVYRRRLFEVTTRRQAGLVLAVFASFALAVPLGANGGPGRMLRPASTLHPLMPYLGNVFYLVGLGPPTMSGVYWGQAPLPHSGIWLGVLLTMASTLGGVAGAGLFVTVVRRIRHSSPAEQDSRPWMLRALLAAFAGVYLLWLIGTSTFIFDRYLLPLLPVVVLLGLDAAPREVACSRVVVACLAVSGLFSMALTREYLAWNDARDRAVRALHARGVPPADIDGGFEQNGPLHFEAFVKRTGKLLSGEFFWVEGARYRISFWPSRTPECTTEERYPYWTWPGGGDPAIYVLHCPAPSDGPAVDPRVPGR